MPDSSVTRKAVWFYNFELALLAEGGFHLTITGTTIDEEGPQLIHQEILDERVNSIDDALARLSKVLTV